MYRSRPVQPAGSPPAWALAKRKREEARGSIGEYIFIDADGFGVPKMHSGIVGVTVELMQAGGCWGNIVIATKVTGADGDYKFDNLSAGEYIVKVSNVPDDLVHVCGLDNPQAGTVTVNLGAGEKNDDVDIGFDHATEVQRACTPPALLLALRNASNQQLLLELARRMR
jgi:hypothetical protein